MIQIDQLTEKSLANLFDHTQLHADARRADFEKLCAESRQYGFKMVAINPGPVALCKQLLTGSDVHVGAAIGFPLGQTSLASKLFETRQSIQDGADEIDYVIDIGAVKDQRFDFTREEMRRMVSVCREANVICKVIFENCYLTKDEIRKVAEIALDERPDFIKTSTGFGTGGATAEDVALMKSVVGDAVKVKAAGGIRGWESCRAMLQAGAERIGTSSSLKILDEFRSWKKQ